MKRIAPSARMRENSSQFVCLSTSDFEDDGVFTFETGIQIEIAWSADTSVCSRWTAT